MLTPRYLIPGVRGVRRWFGVYPWLQNHGLAKLLDPVTYSEKKDPERTVVSVECRIERREA